MNASGHVLGISLFSAVNTVFSCTARNIVNNMGCASMCVMCECIMGNFQIDHCTYKYLHVA